MSSLASPIATAVSPSTLLQVAPMPMASCVDASVFDAWSWCASDVIEWRRPPLRDDRVVRAVDGDAGERDANARIAGHNPAGLVFVMRERESAAAAAAAASQFLPTELARLHAFGYGLVDELALAPWAIDDATDLLFAHRARPHDVFWLAADSLAALVWGLHDWAHFHNHGPFDQPAMTELQCDLLALEWLRRNAPIIDGGIDDEQLASVAVDLATLSRRRFVEEGTKPPVDDLDALFRGPYPASPP